MRIKLQIKRVLLFLFNLYIFYFFFSPYSNILQYNKKIWENLFIEIDTLILKFIGNTNGFNYPKVFKKKKKNNNKGGRITQPDHNTYFTFFCIIGSIQQTVYNI